jgi:hypothetical protein
MCGPFPRDKTGAPAAGKNTAIASISQNQSKRQIQALTQWMNEAVTNPSSAAKAHEAALAHPCAHHVWPLGQLWVDLAGALDELGRRDEAVEARARAVEVEGHDPAGATSCNHCGYTHGAGGDR